MIGRSFPVSCLGSFLPCNGLLRMHACHGPRANILFAASRFTRFRRDPLHADPKTFGAGVTACQIGGNKRLPLRSPNMNW
jgi:hypothetical protein